MGLYPTAHRLSAWPGLSLEISKSFGCHRSIQAPDPKLHYTASPPLPFPPLRRGPHPFLPAVANSAVHFLWGGGREGTPVFAPLWRCPPLPSEFSLCVTFSCIPPPPSLGLPSPFFLAQLFIRVCCYYDLFFFKFSSLLEEFVKPLECSCTNARRLPFQTW